MHDKRKSEIWKQGKGELHGKTIFWRGFIFMIYEFKGIKISVKFDQIKYLQVKLIVVIIRIQAMDRYDSVKNKLQRETAALLAERRQLESLYQANQQLSQPNRQSYPQQGNIPGISHYTDSADKTAEVVDRLQEIIQLCKSEGSLSYQEMRQVLKVENEVLSFLHRATPVTTERPLVDLGTAEQSAVDTRSAERPGVDYRYIERQTTQPRALQTQTSQVQITQQNIASERQLVNQRPPTQQSASRPSPVIQSRTAYRQGNSPRANQRQASSPRATQRQVGSNRAIQRQAGSNRATQRQATEPRGTDRQATQSRAVNRETTGPRVFQSQIDQTNQQARNQNHVSIKQSKVQQYENSSFNQPQVDRSRAGLSQNTLIMIAEIQRKALNQILHLQRDRDQIKLEKEQLRLERNRLASELENYKSKLANGDESPRKKEEARLKQQNTRLKQEIKALEEKRLREEDRLRQESRLREEKIRQQNRVREDKLREKFMLREDKRAQQETKLRQEWQKQQGRFAEDNKLREQKYQLDIQNRLRQQFRQKQQRIREQYRQKEQQSRLREQNILKQEPENRDPNYLPKQSRFEQTKVVDPSFLQQQIRVFEQNRLKEESRWRQKYNRLGQENRLLKQQNSLLRNRIQMTAERQANNQTSRYNIQPILPAQSAIVGQFDPQIQVYENQLRRASAIINELKSRLINVPGIEILHEQGQKLRRQAAQILLRVEGWGSVNNAQLIKQLQQKLEEEQVGKDIFLEQLKKFKQKYQQLEEECKALKKASSENPKSNLITHSRVTSAQPTELGRKKAVSFAQYESTLNEMRNVLQL